ncbi:DNA polymerase III subunit beta [Clostridium sp. YIM B02515]|uniref:Beta sliding clamp n=1 Tax=Clostridium rhizosphaerae TaxID=2803861 RepID=A0ABS1T7F8_9CLOT|nr:DNA polymerase III subunit beta [Clostridium rhizosphaerae]MBL4935067.1 DNA polymerase III subunit beta [Clostridium rhizosphaerae]
MKFIINKNEFQQAVQEIQRVSTGRFGVTILQGILIQCSDSHIILTGGDKNLCIETRISAKVLETGKILIDSKLLGDIVRKLPDSQIELSTIDRNTIRLICEKDVINLGCQSTENFPILPTIKENLAVSVSKEAFRSMVKRTIIATDQNGIRPVFSGILFDLKTDMLVMVALDNTRAAICRHESNSANSIRVVIPGRTLIEVTKIVEWEEEDVEISFTSNQILFTIGNTKVISTLLDGDFGNYESFIPNEYTLEIIVNKEKLIGHLERASIIGKESNFCAVILDISDNTMMITSKSSIGDITGEVDIISRGMPMRMKCNSKFLIEALNTLEDEEVMIKFTTSQSVLVITNKNNTNTLHIIAPVRM